MRRPHTFSIFVFLVLGVFFRGTTAGAQVIVTVPASTRWVDTGIDMAPGNRLLIVPSGQWSNGGAEPRMVGPEGWAGTGVAGLIAPRLPLGALIGRAGGRPFLVGPRYEGPSRAGGRLFLSMNDLPAAFSDNQGSLQVIATVLPSIAVQAGSELPGPSVFFPEPQFTALAGLVLGGGRLQLSHTSNGIARTIDNQSRMSYIEFGEFLRNQGIADFPIELPVVESSLEQVVGNTGGTVFLAQDLLLHKLVFIHRVRFLLNNIHSDFGQDLSVRLGEGEVMVDLRLRAPDPAVRGEAEGYTGVLFIPIPLGWQDGLWPDIEFHDMIATLHLSPIVEDGKLRLADPRVELSKGFSLSVADGIAEDVKETSRRAFEVSLTALLSKPAVKVPLETALTSLFLNGNPNAGIEFVAIDANGVAVGFRP